MGTPLTVKEQARKALEQLNDSATWADVIYTMYIHEKRARGVADSLAGRTFSMDEIARHFGVKTRLSGTPLEGDRTTRPNEG